MKTDKSHSTNDTTASNYVEGNVKGSNLAGHDITTAGEDAISGDKIINITHHYHYGETKPKNNLIWFLFIVVIVVIVVIAFFLSPKLQTISNNFKAPSSPENTLVSSAPETANSAPPDTPTPPATDTTAAVPEKLPFAPEMVPISGGCFQMGSPKTEKDRFDDEKQHEVCVKDFQIGKYEVTQSQWLAVMGNNPSTFKGENQPVEQVSWKKVQTFLEKLNAKTGKNYRLPTEEEWFAACQAVKSTGYCGSNTLADVGWGYDNQPVNPQAHPVGQKQPNAWGLYDMSGNVWEWTSSCNDSFCAGRVMRGGSWGTTGSQISASYRLWYSTEYHNSDLGFRLALDPKDK